RVVDARFATLSLLTGDDHVVTVQPLDLPDELAQRYTELTLASDVPHCVAIRTGEPVVLTSLADVAARYPHILDHRLRLGIDASAAFPLFDSEGRAIGAVSFGWTEPTAFDAGFMTWLDTVTEL